MAIVTQKPFSSLPVAVIPVMTTMYAEACRKIGSDVSLQTCRGGSVSLAMLMPVC